eukprot:g16779.t1
MSLQASCGNIMAFTAVQPTLTFNAIAPARQTNLRRRRRPPWTTPTTPATATTTPIPAAGWRPREERESPIPPPALAASRREPQDRATGPSSSAEDNSPPPSPKRPSSSSLSSSYERKKRSGHGNNAVGGATKRLPLPKSPPAFRAPPPAPRAPPAPAPRQSPPPPPPPSSKREKRPRLPVPPLQRAFGMSWGGGQEGGGRGEEVSVEQMQMSIEELLGMQGLGSGSWNKDGGVPAAVEREQRTLVREIKALGRRGRWGEVLEVIARARYQGTELNAIIYGCAINAVGRCGRYREAVMLLEQMPEEDIEPDEGSYKAAIIACSGANQWERALALFRGFQRATTVVPGKAMYNAVITACARGSYSEEALAFFREMAERGVPRDEVSYNAAIDACARGGMWQRALDLLSEMRTTGPQPSVVSYNAALDACGREGRWEEAADLIDVMRGSAAHEAEDDENDPDSELLEELLRLMDDGESGTPSPLPPTPPRGRETPPHTVAETTAAKMGSTPRDGPPASWMASSWSRPSSAPPPAPDARSYNACIAACRRSGKYGLARLFFLEMMSRGLKPDVWTFKSALLPHSQKLSVEEPSAPAFPAAKHSRQGSSSSSSSSAAAAAAAAPVARYTQSQEHRSAPQLERRNENEAGVFWRQALLMLEEVDAEGLGPDAPCVSLVLSECARAGRWEESRNLLEDLREASPRGSSYHPNLSRYNSVLTLLRNAPARARRGISTAAAGEDPVDLDGGGKRSGAEGWANGHVSGFLSDMRAAGVTPDNETYQYAIRCATDAAMLDIANAAAAEAEEEAEAEAEGLAVAGEGETAVEGDGGGGGGGAPKSVSGDLLRAGGEQ